VLGAVLLQAQGRGGSEWTTSGFDAQRTGSIGSDPRLSLETMQTPGAFGPFQFLWQLKLEYDPAASGRLTQPVLLDRIVGFRGFKSIAFVGTESGTLHAIDVDFGIPLWKYHLNYSASPPPVVGISPECTGGLVAAGSRPTAISPGAAGGRGGGRRGGGSGGGVGEPGQGAITIPAAGQGRGAPAAAAPARGGGPAGAVPGSAAAAAGNAPGGLPAGARAGGGGGGGRGGPFVPGQDATYIVGNDGYLHALNVQNGWENMTPELFLPANTRAAGLIVATPAEGDPVAYVATTHGCGSQPDGIWAMALGDPDLPVTAYQPDGANIAGSEGFALGADGTIYLATTDGDSSMSGSVIALAPGTLAVKATAKVPMAGFSTSPVVIEAGTRELVAVEGGGKVYLFDTASLASGPIATSAAFDTAGFDAGSLTSWTGSDSMIMIAAPSRRGIVVFKLAPQGSGFALQPGWTSREIMSPVPALVINGVLFTASQGSRTASSVLYAFDASTGRDLWNSGSTITSSVRARLSGGGGNVYVPGADGTLYAFGFAIEK